MAEISTAPPPYEDYPIMFGGNALPLGFKEVHAANRAFSATVIPPSAKGPTELDYLTIETCATALTAADYRLGRNTASHGTMQTENGGDGLWLTQPTYYHNGDGTRLAMLGTKAYMDYSREHLDGEASPYADRPTYIATMLTAAYDDIVFGKYGRGEDERQSAALARTHLLLQGFPHDMVEDVVTGIEASVFNEQTGTQDYNPDRGAEPVQRGSLVGDLWALGTPQGTANTFLLMVENLWKRDLAATHGQALRSLALKQAVDYMPSWQGERLVDFFEVAESYHTLTKRFSAALIANKGFLLADNRYVDPRVTELMRPALQQNALLQEHLGSAVTAGELSITGAFQCALSYADGYAWRDGQRRNAALGGPQVYTAEKISELLLTPHPISDLQNPVDAQAFYDAFTSERSSNKS